MDVFSVYELECSVRHVEQKQSSAGQKHSDKYKIEYRDVERQQLVRPYVGHTP